MDNFFNTYSLLDKVEDCIGKTIEDIDAAYSTMVIKFTDKTAIAVEGYLDRQGDMAGIQFNHSMSLENLYEWKLISMDEYYAKLAKRDEAYNKKERAKRRAEYNRLKAEFEPKEGGYKI